MGGGGGLWQERSVIRGCGHSRGVRTHPGHMALQVTPLPAVSKATVCSKHNVEAHQW